MLACHPLKWGSNSQLQWKLRTGAATSTHTPGSLVDASKSTVHLHSILFLCVYSEQNEHENNALCVFVPSLRQGFSPTIKVLEKMQLDWNCPSALQISSWRTSFIVVYDTFSRILQSLDITQGAQDTPAVHFPWKLETFLSSVCIQ